MIDIREKNRCCGCNSCGDVCPQNAISYVTDDEGFWYPDVNRDKCINCGLCEKVCPIIQKKEKFEKNFSTPHCFVAEHKSMETIFSSTTGGIFSALAEVMYGQKGYVGGAIHNKDLSVSEFISDNREDLQYLRRSKDLQSDARGFYKRVKKLLEDGENVLICGLPCQIAGLKCYVGRDYDNLITADLICLGVNSPKVWKSYIEYIEAINHSKIVWTENKSKEYGWHKLTQKFVFENGEEYFDTVDTSEFIKGFIESHIYCRPSCYNCQFKGFPRTGDFTIGDFWGIEKYDSSYNSNMGTSVVLINSVKGEQYFEKVKKRINYKEVPLHWAVSGNPALTKSITNPTVSRKTFFENLDKMSFDKTVKEYGSKNSKSIKHIMKEIRKNLSFVKRIIVVTRLSPVALFQTFRYSGLRNLIKKRGILFGNHSVVNIDRSSIIQIEGLLTIGCKGHFPKSKLESRLCLGKNSTLRILGDFEVEYDCDIEVFENAELIIHGKKFVKSDANEGLTIICGEKIEIGHDVGIGRNVHIRDTNGNHQLNTIGYRTTRPVTIGEKVWLCESCKIMPGVKIGRSAVIGVNSVVLKSVPAHTLVSGYPATVIQDNVYWKR